MALSTVTQQWNGKDVKIRGKRIVNKSAFEIGLIVEAQAKNLINNVTGLLAGSITTQKVGKGTNPQVPATTKDVISAPIDENEVFVGTAVEYAPYVEFGTAPHAINASVKIPGVGWRYIGMHPGFTARPFLRPALDLARGRALTIVEKEGRFEFREYLR